MSGSAAHVVVLLVALFATDGSHLESDLLLRGVRRRTARGRYTNKRSQSHIVVGQVGLLDLAECMVTMMAPARKHCAVEEIMLWTTPSEPPRALQASECNELLDPTRASCLILAQRQPGKFTQRRVAAVMQSR